MNTRALLEASLKAATCRNCATIIHQMPTEEDPPCERWKAPPSYIFFPLILGITDNKAFSLLLGGCEGDGIHTSESVDSGNKLPGGGGHRLAKETGKGFPGALHSWDRGSTSG